MSDRLPRPEPRDAFKRALRAQLMAQAPSVLARRETAWSRFKVSLMRPAFAIAAVVLVLVAGAGKAAADSLPGDLARRSRQAPAFRQPRPYESAPPAAHHPGPDRRADPRERTAPRW